MLTKQQFIGICDFTHHYLEQSVSGCDQDWVKSFPRAAEHRWQHTLNVLRNAEKLLAGENSSQDISDIVKVSAVMHDISMFVCDHTIHGQVSAELAGKYLAGQGFSADFTAHVTQAISEHGVDFDTLPPGEMGARFSPEGKMLIEADLLDKFGACALTSALLEMGKDGLLPCECRAALSSGANLRRAQYFKDYIWTETGRRLRDERLGFFLRFLDQLSEEVVETIDHVSI